MLCSEWDIYKCPHGPLMMSVQLIHLHQCQLEVRCTRKKHNGGNKSSKKHVRQGMISVLLQGSCSKCKQQNKESPS